MLATSRSAMLQPSYAVLAVRHDPVPPRRGPGGAGHPPRAVHETRLHPKQRLCTRCTQTL
jgi:hypothetical protein